MMRSMAKRKVAITIDEELYDTVVRLADERDESVSAWISEAARLQAANAELGALIEEYESEHSRITPDEVRKAHEPWQPRRRRRAA
jgi:hypothetical protein